MPTNSSRKVKTYGREQYEIHESLQPDAIARFAADIIAKWGMVSAVEDGEDSAGRQKLRLMTPDELVVRAFDVAESFMEMAKDRDHLLFLPPLEDQPEED